MNEDLAEDFYNKFKDKIYFYASDIKIDENEYFINVNEKSCLSILNEKIKSEAINYLLEKKEDITWLKNSPTVFDLRSGNTKGWFKQLTKNLLKAIHFRNLFSMISF
jgi:hypothetical protein